MTLHPLIVRLTHWTNAAAMTVMVMSGWEIHNAHPIASFPFPSAITLGGGLIGALQWHFAAMWVLAANGLIYVTYGLVSGRFRRKLTPISPRDAIRDALSALRGRLGHEDLSVYNGVQRLLYAGVIVLGILIVLSGLAIWKPVQLGWLTALMGDFDNARIIHFAAMAGIVLFAAVHVPMALLVPRSLLAMIRGR
ncbi:cytochrome b/b6 domain-containing protein [Sphingobium fluviale]|jgi:thiosulfate reductase cytochrome b subunit|uniref:Cytochrome b/b6 domain-containing protein n=1 Tax=Sphingobium fluviale TaxID=2506423 RepID=A0A4Q1KML9_9SPHN|nr:cytochrome b/b6 domain-containing protein [Sphingobium fluviale]RXR30775.1 cytochrome b/b6 domain-containing protein [Sphingobium fluviale]